MFTEQQIADLVASKLELVKKQFPPHGKPKKAPAYHSTYLTGVEYMNRVKVHAEVGDFPEHLFMAKAPNMTKLEYGYLKDNFKQTTLPTYIDFHSTVSLPFNDGNWSIEFQEDDSIFLTSGETLQEYLEVGIKKYNSLENFVTSTMSHIKNVDANGIICIRPDIEDIEFIDDETVDTSVLYSPQPYYYESSKIIARKMDEYYLVLLDDRSPVSVGNDSNKQNIGFIFEFYDEENIYRITQVGKHEEFRFEYTLILNHNWGRVPAKELRGIPKVVNNEIVWQPPFLYSCDNLDLALMNAQYLQVSISYACFPYLVMVGDPCTHEIIDEATQQRITCIEGRMAMPDQTMRICPKCAGSGLKDRVSPMGRLLIKKDDWTDKGDSFSPAQAMTYVSPDVSALEFVNKITMQQTDNARRILHLKTSASTVQPQADGNTPALSSMLDQKAKAAFVKPISTQNFENWQFLIDAIGWQRYGAYYKAPVIMSSNNVDYNTEEDWMYKIGEAKDKNLPPAIIETMYYQYLRTVYFYEKLSASVFTLMLQTDRILTLSQDDINIKLSRGLIDKWEIVLHDSGRTFIDELLGKNEKFFEQEFDTQKEQLIARAKEVANSIVSPTQTLQKAAINNALSVA